LRKAQKRTINVLRSVSRRHLLGMFMPQCCVFHEGMAGRAAPNCTAAVTGRTRQASSAARLARVLRRLVRPRVGDRLGTNEIHEVSEGDAHVHHV
jgi:hypothetical protein